MNITEKKLENATVELTVEVPAERVEEEYKAVFKRFQSSAKLDGFRKGKAPLQLVQVKYAEAADDQVAENIINSTIYDAVTEKGVSPISDPAYEYEKTSRNESFTYVARFEVLPTVELAEYSGLNEEEKSCNVTDEDVEDEINNMREQKADITLREEEDAVVEDGNFVRVSIKRIDNVEEDQIAAVQPQEYPIVIGKSKDDYGVDKHIGGMKAGEEKDIVIDYPKDYLVEAVAGQKVTYRVLVREINNMKLPELNDEFAKEMSYESVDDLTVKTKEFIEKFVVDKAKSDVRTKLLNKIVENSTFDIPESMVQQEMKIVLAKRLQSMGFPPENIREFQESLMESEDMPEDFRASLREDAERTVKNTIVLTEIARKEELKVQEEKIEEVLQKIAERNGQTVDDVKNMASQTGMIQNIEDDLLLDRTLDFLYEKADVKILSPIPLRKFAQESAGQQ